MELLRRRMQLPRKRKLAAAAWTVRPSLDHAGRDGGVSSGKGAGKEAAEFRARRHGRGGGARSNVHRDATVAVCPARGGGGNDGGVVTTRRAGSMGVPAQELLQQRLWLWLWRCRR